MARHTCSSCSLKARYDERPHSILGRFWRWHINYCPGWKRYFLSLPPEEKEKIAKRYNFSRYQ